MEVNIVKDRLGRWLAPLPAPVRRILILVIGSTVIVFGVLLLVLPGPGILVIIVGLAILATEFAWAEALLVGARKRAARLAKKFRTHNDGRG
jgi:tellurite resistance protein TerC